MPNNAHLQRFLRWWLPLIAVASVLALLELIIRAHPPVAELLQWSRDELARGQWWRLLTGHWVHLGTTHLLLNLAGLLLLGVLFDARLPPAWWAGYLLGSPVAISVGLLWAAPELDWYRGFSGCLHGLFVLLALTNAPSSPRWSALLLALLALKLILEPWSAPIAQFPGSTADLIGAPVIFQAHWLGALTGLAAGLLFVFSSRHVKLKDPPFSTTDASNSRKQRSCLHEHSKRHRNQ